MLGSLHHSVIGRIPCEVCVFEEEHGWEETRSMNILHPLELASYRRAIALRAFMPHELMCRLADESAGECRRGAAALGACMQALQAGSFCITRDRILGFGKPGFGQL
jgi:hypothetical protein